MKFNLNEIPPPNFGKPTKIQKEVARLIEQGSIETRPQKNLMEGAVKKFRLWLYENSAPLTKKEKKHLSWALNIGEDKILGSKDEISRALSFFQFDNISSKSLRGLINSYFFADYVLPENVRLLKDRIRLLLQKYEGRSSKIKHWVELANDVFGSEPELTIATKVWQRKNIAFVDSLESFRIPDESGFYQRCIEKIAFVLSKNAAFPDRLVELLKVVEKINNLESMKRSLDHILQGFVQRNQREIHSELSSFCVRHLGDPRVTKNVKWKGISSSSKDLVVQWLSTEDLTIFFDIVAMDSDRKNFWLQYVSVIEYSRVVFGPDAIRYGNTEIKKFLSQKRHAELKNCNSRESAFILKIKDAVIVEFSHTGNACYFYTKNTAPFNLDARSYSKTNQLKKPKVADDRKSHFTGWEENFKDYLFERFNIKQPGRNNW